MTENKGIVFCNLCHRIVGTSFPVVNHGHSLNFHNRILENNLDKIGFSFFADTQENREFLEKNYPPIDEVKIKL
jgi:hypothetical protein